MRTVTRAVRGGATTIVVGAVLAGVGITSAGAASAAEESGVTDGSGVTDSTDSTDEVPAAPAPTTTTVRLKVGTRDTRRITTEARRPLWLVEKRGIRVDRNDKVLLVRNGRKVREHDRRVLRDRDLVRVVRVRTAVRTHRRTIERPVRIRKVSTLQPGVRKVLRPGRAGVRRIRVHLEWQNGERVRRDVHRSVVRKPRPRVVAVGRSVRSVPGTAHLNWAALARCESGGNPRAVNPAGYYGLYQFNVATWRSVGGSGMPHLASSAEQTYRAKKLYAQRGRSPWPHCGRYL
ncbi:resuscitation-promoting factor [Nocardioides sambongensis]|uniref:resuscitation-promoting factor n=1 Tax=Nocardioides sambongensis TaxID=2589074 RepID=UPI0022AB8970|nr:resuscitation-promoting factor [Nocardioides sambongensis]